MSVLLKMSPNINYIFNRLMIVTSENNYLTCFQCILFSKRKITIISIDSTNKQNNSARRLARARTAHANRPIRPNPFFRFEGYDSHFTGLNSARTFNAYVWSA